MAVQYIPNTPETPLPLPSVRRSARQLATPPAVTRSPSTRRKPRQPRSANSRKRSRPQDEQEDLPSPFGAPITPAPTPRAIRAQKRRRLADESGDAVQAEGAFSMSSSSSSSSPSLSPTMPQPLPISPEPISPTHAVVSRYQMKPNTRSRKRKAQLIEDDAASSASDTPTPPSLGDPHPRSLTKRRKLDRSTPSRSRSKSQLPPTTPSKKRTSTRTSRTGAAPSPRGGNKNVRRSARLVIRINEESQHQHPSDAQLEESIPLSPLTPPPSEDDASEDDADPERPSSSPANHSEEEDDSDMEMVACVAASPLPSPTPLSLIPDHISNPVLKGRPPPNPAIYAQYQLASYRRTKPNTPSPLSLYSYTGGLTPPTSPALSAATSINSLDAIDDIPPLGEAAAVEAIAEGEAALVGFSVAEQQPQMQFYEHGYPHAESPQQQQSEPVFEHQAQPEYRQSTPAPPNPAPPLDMNLMMMDLQFQMQLQQMGMQGPAGDGVHFGVDQMGFLMGGNATEERSEHMPMTVHMQDVHLQQTHHEQNVQQQNQQQIIDPPNHQLYAYPYFSPEQQGSSQLYGSQDSISYGGDSQPFQPEYQQQQRHAQYPQYQAEYSQEPRQAQSSSSYEAFGNTQPYESGSSQVYEHQQPPRQDQARQELQAQHDEALPFSSTNAYDAGAYQTQTQTSSSSITPPTSPIVTPTPVPAATTHMSHYTLSMHNALLYFQQSLSRFHEGQLLLGQDAAEMHARQLEEFQREKEERKRRLKRTKLVREVQVVPMGSSASGAAVGGVSGFAVGRARGLWAVACKARMFEVVRIYTPALIREVTETSAREYCRRMGLKYTSCGAAQSRYRRRMRKGEDDISISEDDTCYREPEEGEVDDGSASAEKKDGLDGDADGDGEEFRKEKIFDFELLDDDEELVEEEDEVRKQTVEDTDEDMYEDEEEDEEEDDEYSDDEDAPENEVDLDLEAMTDPLFQPELSIRITPQGAVSSTAGGLESAFYVPPLEMYAVSEQNTTLCEDQKKDPEPPSDSASNAMMRHSQKQKIMLIHRPVLPLPPPTLSTFRPTALRFYNIDPVHAGRGTPCAKERREAWAGRPSAMSSIRDTRLGQGDDCGGSASAEAAAAGDYESGVTAWYAYADEVQVTAAKSEVSSASTVIGIPCHDAQSVPAPAEDDDSVFGDCIGTCCRGEDVKGKVEAGEKGGIGDGKLEEESVRGEVEACGDDRPSIPAVLPQPNAQPPPPQSPHMTVEIPPAHSAERIPQGRRGVTGRTDLLKVYAPPAKSAPSILPLARRPPRPPPLALEEANAVLRSLTPQTYHHPVVPYSWEQVAEAMAVLAYQGIDASVWVDGHHGHSSTTMTTTSSNGVSGTEVQVQPTFNPSSSELSAALG